MTSRQKYRSFQTTPDQPSHTIFTRLADGEVNYKRH